MRFSAPSKGQGSQYARSGRHTACILSAGGVTHMSSARDKRQRQIAVTGAIGHEHFMAGVRMLYACRYRDAVNHFQEAIMLEPAAKGYLSYLGLAVAHADRKYNDAEQLCRRSIEIEYHRPEHYHNLGEVFLLANRAKDAIKAFNQALSWNPNYEPPNVPLGSLGAGNPPAVRFLPRSIPTNAIPGKPLGGGRNRRAGRPP